MPSPTIHQLLNAELNAVQQQAFATLENQYGALFLSSPESGIYSHDYAVQSQAASGLTGDRNDRLDQFKRQFLNDWHQQALTVDWDNPDERNQFLSDFRHAFAAAAFPELDTSGFLSGETYHTGQVQAAFDEASHSADLNSGDYAAYQAAEHHFDNSYTDLLQGVVLATESFIDDRPRDWSSSMIRRAEAFAGSAGNGSIDTDDELNAVIQCAKDLLQDGIVDRSEDMVNAAQEMFKLNPDQTERLAVSLEADIDLS
ncbi:hypothetical protein GC177_10145 [bacterium]|nr:hypothetical protein [bacterium]